jgi:hypothetical protein
MKRIVLFIIVFIFAYGQQAFAQCAMCRTQLENNVSNGSPGIAAGINTGILYLLVMPYLAIMIVGYFWYKSSRKNEGGFNKRIASR